MRGMDKMLSTPPRRLMARARPRTVLVALFLVSVGYFLLFSSSAPSFHPVPHAQSPESNTKPVDDKPDPPQPATPVDNQVDVHNDGHLATQDQIPGAGFFDVPEVKQHEWDIKIDDIRGWQEADDHEDYNDVEPGYQTDGKDRDAGMISRLQSEKDMRKLWRYSYRITANSPSSNLIYGNTVKTLAYKDNRTESHAKQLKEDPDAQVDFTQEKPVRFNPFPLYNSQEWNASNHAPYVPCIGATGELVEDVMVFKGRPSRFPNPKFGSYDVLDMDANLCWERETRLGQYGFVQQKKKNPGGELAPINWNNVNWGDLQRKCVHKNTRRFELKKSRTNPYLEAYAETSKPADTAHHGSDGTPKIQTRKRHEDVPQIRSNGGDFVKENRTAILLRSYTGKKYTENDKQVIRAMINEVSLKSGGEYEVFLLVHVKDPELRIFDDSETHQRVIRENIPDEFHGITVLWNDAVVWDIYTELKDPNEKTVHTAQWLSVQKFSHDHPQFEYIWNWEMDFRYTGHHYDLLEKLAGFARKQPRRGLWERNERWYVPEYHGDYDTTFRKDVESRYKADATVWGAPDLPFIHPVGPKPPTKTPAEDDYSWGVGEDADMITVGPIFNPIHSNWIIGSHVWGYNDETHHSEDVPRRTTIVTQSRVSKRLLDIMHVENMRGNHVASEMTPQTVALLHGLKAVFAPHPVFMDREWDGKFVNKWFNPGVHGESGGYGSPMGWGRERRYQGVTWYYRAEPPNRLYNNWMGWPDTGIGGVSWEKKHGRTCLPSIMLHPVKDSEPTKPDHASGFELTYG